MFNPFEKLKRLNEERERQREAERAAEDAQLVSLGEVRERLAARVNRNLARASIAGLVLFVAFDLVPSRCNEADGIAFVLLGAAVGVVLGSVLSNLN
jgi:hypothetical protein